MPSLKTVITVLLLPSATARLTTLITEDQITAPLRERAFAALDALPPTHPAIRYQLGYLLTCNRCISIYSAAALLAALAFPPARPLIRILALSQLALTALDATDRLLAPRAASHSLDLSLDLNPDYAYGAPGETRPGDPDQ